MKHKVEAQREEPRAVLLLEALPEQQALRQPQRPQLALLRLAAQRSRDREPPPLAAERLPPER